MAALVRNFQNTPSEPELALSVILPASNEESLIGACLKSVLASDWPHAQPFELILVANGCHDKTADVARDFITAFSAAGHKLIVLDIPEGGKLNALNQGDLTAQTGIRIYLDADVTVSPPLLSGLFSALNSPLPRYASGVVEIAPAQTWSSRAYRRIYSQVPFMTHGVPGCGLFAVNKTGRDRWDDFPDIISDDTFVRLSFAPSERVSVQAGYQWPIVEGLSNLIKVRRRQNQGVEEIEATYPQLMANDDKPRFSTAQKLSMALRDPFGFAVYSGVALIVKLTGKRQTGWSRGR